MPHYAGVDENGEALYTAYYDANRGEFGKNAADIMEEGEKGDIFLTQAERGGTRKEENPRSVAS